MTKPLVTLALIAVAIGIVYVLIQRPSIPTTAVVNDTTGNSLLALGASAFKFFTSPGGKAAPPSAVVDVGGNEGTYQPSTGDTINGNTLEDSSGNTLTYGTD